MRYQGGKSRIAKPITQAILSAIMGGEKLSIVSLFCGTCSLESKLAESGMFDQIICNDLHPYLIKMLQGVSAGYELPDYVSKEQYDYIRNHKDEDPVLAGFVGFGCSFGGKWFGGYARNITNTNYAMQSKRSLLKDLSNLNISIYTNLDYRDVYLPDNCIVLADPPYVNTTKYNHKNFDHDAFWEYAKEVSQTHQMFICEQVAPEDFVSIWYKEIARTLDVISKINSE